MTPDEDFNARSTATGVVAAYGLDTETQLQAEQVVNSSTGVRRGFIDDVVKVSGAGSLRFLIPAGHSAPNIAGAWSADLGQNFGQGNTMYVQFRFRYSPRVLTNNSGAWTSSLKLSNIHGPSLTCQSTEYTTIMQQDARITAYRACGIGFDTHVTTNALTVCGGGDCLKNQGSQIADGPNVGYNCHYQNQFEGDGNGNGCPYIKANVWYTMYQRLQVGAFGGSTTAYDAWIQRDGGPMLQFHRVANVPWNNDDDNHFSKIRLETYMTEISGAASFDSYVWYDELIISTQPIAAPAAVPPSIPTGVSVS